MNEHHHPPGTLTVASAPETSAGVQKIYLFGSRIHDTARGGDVDLWLRSGAIGYEDTLRLKIRIQARLGGRRVDLLVNAGEDHPLAAVVADTGVRL